MNVTQCLYQMRPEIFFVEDRTDVPNHTPYGSEILGTAFTVSPEGWLITARHVVEGMSKPWVRSFYNPISLRYAMGQPSEVTEVLPHPTLDIALLKVPEMLTEARRGLVIRRGDASFLHARIPEIGKELALVGWAEGIDLAFADDILGHGSPKSYTPTSFVGHLSMLIPDDQCLPELISYDMTSFPGCSGGPVVDTASGEVLAVHIASVDRRFGYGIPLYKISPFLNKHIPHGLRVWQGSAYVDSISSYVNALDKCAEHASANVGYAVPPYVLESALSEITGTDPRTLHIRFSSESEISEKVKDRDFSKDYPRPFRIRLDEHAIPVERLAKSEERRIKVNGEIWVVHKYDADPFPSSPHAHNYQTKMKLHLGSGELFRGRSNVGTISSGTLNSIRSQIGNTIPLPPLEG